ncbi:hydroxymethylglutaryl-CoA lyase [Photobacterium damselae]|uniref:hydroxymethylglutaryl-CoA lyase n=1 Tax=Photobacterium damselae TaxID=38293 RepID=UPI0035A94C81
MDVIQQNQQIIIGDVFPRDGIQNLDQLITTEEKKLFIKSLVDIGIKDIEVTSFVNPKLMHQFYDAKEIADFALNLAQGQDILISALAPNYIGAKNLYDSGLRNMNYVVSVSEAHNLKNINRTVKKSIDDLKSIKDQLPDLNIRLTLATVFGCPFTGYVPTELTINVLNQAHELGIVEVTLCDTIGVANPYQVRTILNDIMSMTDNFEFSMHMHNTHGMALASIYQGILSGIKRFETAIGGLGGCPFAPGAAGNVATEDVINMIHRMGFNTGINLEELLTILQKINATIPNKINSHLFKARSYSEFNFYQGE